MTMKSASLPTQIVQRICRGHLSKNFDDAIAIARRLGIQYIWIDSICIIQGSEDWDQEKWKMGQYYQHALFTISAIGRGAQPMHGGSFLDASPARAPKFLVRLPFRQEGVRKGSVYLYRRDHNAYLLFHTDGPINWPPRGIHAQPALKVLSAECEPAPQGIHNLPEAAIMTLQLRVKAKMQPALVVPGLQNRSGIGELTDTLFLPQFRPNRHTATSTRTKPDSNEPYAVCHPSSPGLIGGWAMFERSPEVGEWTDTPSGTVTLAIHVGSRRTGDGTALIRDFLNLGRTVYEVIFVESIGNNTFRRLGAGMIFDCNVIKGFQRDEEIEIILK
ncbi:hypothetical protein CEP54_004084 [Fusarium duplospermum]|uniref:Heterokaryon incompatibility domain-containing protein n=1 Tax=Fusarium duplospermum TaxID=1325734 RepID=A0A428QKY5_9HYPO|nr:hypothetical protein CEP54_004084 [Fusarium duplospermum]